MNPEQLAEVVAGLALALTFGGMTFFSAVMAPLVFTQLPFDTAAGFIRRVFPWYYLVMGICALVALVGLWWSALPAWLAGVTALVVVGFALARQGLMPRINAARDGELAGDAGAARRFQALHRASVILNVVQWLAVLVVLVAVLW
jgi:hypothetical protein